MPSMHSPRFRVLAALLLSSQGLAGASVGLAHASERVAAPAAIEAEHSSACAVEHDPARCSACKATGVGTLPEPYRARLAGAGRSERMAPAGRPTPAVRHFLSAAAPRAPPLPLA
jgi:hypothetical protein